jgi:DNA-binding NtrC family response regulator
MNVKMRRFKPLKLVRRGFYASRSARKLCFGLSVLPWKVEGKTEVKMHQSREPMNGNEPLVCIIDDDLSVRESLSDLLESVGLKAQAFASADEFLTRSSLEVPGCLVLDVQLPGISGLDLQQQLRSGDTQIPIVFMTGYGDIPTSVRAMKAGAIEFLTKPCRDQDLLSAVNQAIERGRAIDRLKDRSAEDQSHRENAPRDQPSFSEIVGESAALHQVLKEIELVAPSEATVLILGETGTGKELIAQAVHQRSRRKDKPLVRVNCTSIPKELFESEFFGHSKGAFTGAIRDRAGRFEVAAGGTLFLDEVGEIPLALQSKLLRVLQEKCYERVGEEKTRRADVRIVAATNRDLEKEVAAGHFREDLYYRLNVFRLKIAPLRERKGDIPLLAAFFLNLVAKDLGCPKPRLTPAGIETLQNYDWPGNIRELRNAIERAVIFARGGALEFDLPGNRSNPASFERVDVKRPEPEILTEPEIRRRERDNIFAVLQKTSWKIKGADGAAELMGLKPSTLISRIAKMGLKKPDFGPRSQTPEANVRQVGE